MLRQRNSRAGATAPLIAAVTLVAISLPVACYAVSPVIAINEEAKKAVVHPQLVRGDISVIEGSGGNITVLTRPEGKLLVDGGISYSKDTLVQTLQTISSAPPSLLLTLTTTGITPTAMRDCTNSAPRSLGIPMSTASISDQSVTFRTDGANFLNARKLLIA